MGLLNLPSISVTSFEEDDLDYRIQAEVLRCRLGSEISVRNSQSAWA